jgi:hypothetical protein
MAAVINDCRQLGPPAVSRAAAGPAATVEIIATDIMVFQARGIDTGFARGAQQPELASLTDDFS